MLREIVHNIAALEEDVEVVDDAEAELDLRAAMALIEPELVIVAGDDLQDTEVAEALRTCAGIKILVLTEGGRVGRLHEFFPRATAIGDVSPATLVRLIQSAREAGPDRDLGRQ
jgi:hypothetical protein